MDLGEIWENALMQMSDSLKAEIDAFLTDYITFLQNQIDTSRTYPPRTKYGVGSGVIELKGGILVQESTESVLVLDKEYTNTLLDRVVELYKEITTNIELPLVGFAERPLFELITLWLFIQLHESVEKEIRERIKVLLFAGHYKFYGSKQSLNNYLRSRGDKLTRLDKSKLMSEKLDETSASESHVWRASICWVI